MLNTMTSTVASNGRTSCFRHDLRTPLRSTAEDAGSASAPPSAPPPAVSTAQESGDENMTTGEAVATLVRDAAKHEHWKTVRALLASENNVRLLLHGKQQTTRNLFEHAVQSGDACLLDELLKGGLHERVKGSRRFVKRLVVSIVQEGDAEMLALLLQRAQRDQQTQPAMENQDSMDECEPDPLVLVVQQDNEPLINVLLDFGADPNAQCSDSEAWTVLHIAAEWGNSNVVTRLLHAGANAEARSSEGEMPLHVAVRGGHIETVNVLLYAGADVNSKNENGQTPLHIASVEGLTNVMTTLLQHGALVDARDENGSTPLHLGAFFDENGARFARGVDDTQAAVVRLLLKHGADLNIRDSEGCTVLENAQRDTYDVIVDMLVDHMQRQTSTRRRLS